MNMYHNKEIMNSKLSIIVDLPESEAEREDPTLSKIRFGELEVGDKFVFDGCWLVKTSEYRAESDKKRGKNHFLFFKKDIVQHEYLGDICHDEIDNHLLLHENGSDQATKFFTPKTGRFSDKYDLFDDHHDMIEDVREPSQNLCVIAITPKADGRHNIDVIENEGDYSWSTVLIGDLDLYWSVMIRLKKVTLNLVYGDNEIKLLHLDREVWSRRLEGGWSGINCCTITIKDIRLDS